MRQRDTFLVFTNPPQEVVDGVVLALGADGRRKDGCGHIAKNEHLFLGELISAQFNARQWP